MHKISKANVMFLECPICLGTDFYTGKFSILNDYGIKCASCGLSMETSITDNKMTKEKHEIACLKKLEEMWNRRLETKTKLKMSSDGFYACRFCGSTDIECGAFDISPDWFVSCENCGAYIEGSIPWNGMTKEEHDAACFKAGHEAWNQCARKVEQK